MLCEIARSADWHSSASTEAAKGIDPGGETRRAAPACDSRRVLHLDDVAARRSMACRRELTYPRTKFDLGTYPSGYRDSSIRLHGNRKVCFCPYTVAARGGVVGRAGRKTPDSSAAPTAPGQSPGPCRWPLDAGLCLRRLRVTNGSPESVPKNTRLVIIRINIFRGNSDRQRVFPSNQAVRAVPTNPAEDRANRFWSWSPFRYSSTPCRAHLV